MLRESFSRLRAHPKSLWTVILGATLVVPIIFTALLVALSQEVAAAGTAGYPLYVLAALFGAAFVLATSYFHALVVNAAHGVQKKKKFGFLDIFREARGLFGRILALDLLFSVPLLALAGLGFVLSGAAGIAVLVAAGLWLLLAPFLFLRAGVHLKQHSLLVALKRSFAEVRTKWHYVRWGYAKLCAFAVTALFFAGAYGTLEAAPWGLLAGLAVVYLLLLLNGVLSPMLLFAVLVLYGAQGSLHFFAVLFAQLLFFLFVHVLLVSDR